MGYYVRKRGIFDPNSKEPFRLSRSKIDLFIECPRCFYLDRRLGVVRPDMPAFTLNSAVDHLLKKEFDVHRANREPHPLMTAYKIQAIPFEHPDLDIWRENFKGMQYLDKENNFLITGAIDDVWQDKDENLIVVDYKATSKKGEIELTDSRWHNQYRRQMEIYQWILEKNGFKVSPIGYFVYVNGDKDKEAFDAKLEFDVAILPYEGDNKWIPDTLLNVKKCLVDDRIPKANKDCEYCHYVHARNEAARDNSSKKDQSKDSGKLF